MGRSKIPITWIKSDASRQVTFNKRKKGMKKKAEELAILCGVDVCMICFGPTISGSGKQNHSNQSSNPAAAASGSNSQPQSSAGSSSSSSAAAATSTSMVPFSWGMPGVSSVINKFEGLPKEERDKKKLDNTSLLEQQIKKLRRELKGKLDQNWKLEQERAYFAFDDRLDCYSVEELKRLADCLLDKLRISFERISCFEDHHHRQQQQQQEEDHHLGINVHQLPSAEVDDFTNPSRLVNSASAFLPLIDPFVLPSQQQQQEQQQQSGISLNLNPSVMPATAQDLRGISGFTDHENFSLIPLGIGPSTSSHLISGNQVWNSSAAAENWSQSSEEAPIMHSMMLSSIAETDPNNSDESKPEFRAEMQQSNAGYL